MELPPPPPSATSEPEPNAPRDQDPQPGPTEPGPQPEPGAPTAPTTRSSGGLLVTILVAAVLVAGAIIYAVNANKPEPTTEPVFVPLPAEQPTYSPPPKPTNELQCDLSGGVWVEDPDGGGPGGACAGV